MLKVIKSDSQELYYAIEVDEAGNQKVVAEAQSLEALKRHPDVPNNSIAIPEEETRATREATE